MPVNKHKFCLQPYNRINKKHNLYFQSCLQKSDQNLRCYNIWRCRTFPVLSLKPVLSKDLLSIKSNYLQYLLSFSVSLSRISWLSHTWAFWSVSGHSPGAGSWQWVCGSPIQAPPRSCQLVDTCGRRRPPSPWKNAERHILHTSPAHPHAAEQVNQYFKCPNTFIRYVCMEITEVNFFSFLVIISLKIFLF